MSRWWAAIPLAILVAVPICTTPSIAIATIESVAVVLCILGVAGATTGAVTAGCVIAIIGYAAALQASSADFDMIGGGIFGLALLFLLDVSEFARRFRGVEVADRALRAQLAYWIERTAIICGLVIVLALAAFVVSPLVPPGGRAIAAGLGALLAFAGAVYGAWRSPSAR